jgi:hypothetical protein
MFKLTRKRRELLLGVAGVGALAAGPVLAGQGQDLILPLPARPAEQVASVDPAFAEYPSGALPAAGQAQALAAPFRLIEPPRPVKSRAARAAMAQRRQAQAAAQAKAPRPARRPVVLAGPPTPLEKAMLRDGMATAPSDRAKPAPWPMIILAAYDGELKASPGARKVEFDSKAFKSDPTYQDKPYDPNAQLEIYGGKKAVNSQRPVVELGTPLYDVGPLGQGANLLGQKNLLFGYLYVFGDWRTAVAYNDNKGEDLAQVATRVNLDIDLGLTATERIHALIQPLQDGAKFTRCELSGSASNDECELESDLDPQTLFFEGDAGAITAGLTGSYVNWDLPFTGGLIPLLFQNGIWVEDAFWGGAASLPSLNSKALDISNADITVFGGFDDVEANGIFDANGAIADENVNVYGFATFLETLGGYIEAGYGYADDQGQDGVADEQDYHSATLAFTKRYGNWLSNSIRVIGSFGQDKDVGDDQNGVMFLVENSLVSSKPYTVLPYANFFLGIERPVPLARDNAGILKNTGINFESDALTGYPFLNDTGQNAYGGAIGIQYLFELDQQLVFELAAERNLSDVNDGFDDIVGNQYAVGARYQIPLSKAWLIRTDATYQIIEGDDNSAGARVELRWKF